MKTDLEKIVKELDWVNPNQEPEPEEFALAVANIELFDGFETQVSTSKDTIKVGIVKVREVDRLHFKTPTSEYVFPGGMGLDILKRMKKPLFKKNLPDYIIKNDKRHLKFVKWFEIIKDKDFVLDLEMCEKHIKEYEELERQIKAREIDWFEYNIAGKDYLRVHDKLVLSTLELPAFMRMYKENRRP